MNAFIHSILVVSVIATSSAPLATLRKVNFPLPVEDFKPVKIDVDSLDEVEEETNWGADLPEFHLGGEFYLALIRTDRPLTESDLVHRSIRLQI